MKPRYEYDSVPITDDAGIAERKAAGWEAYMTAKSSTTGVEYQRFRRIKK